MNKLIKGEAIMTLVNCTKSCLGIFDTKSYQNVEIYEIPTNYETFQRVSKGIKKCRHCHKELDDWEKVVCIQWHFENNKKTRVSYQCYACASGRM